MSRVRREFELKPFVPGALECSKCGSNLTIRHVSPPVQCVWIGTKSYQLYPPAPREFLMIICETCGFVDGMECKPPATVVGQE
jgi:hypothetical protein